MLYSGLWEWQLYSESAPCSTNSNPSPSLCDVIVSKLTVSAIDRGFDTRTGKSKENKISSIEECKQSKARFVKSCAKQASSSRVFMKGEFEGVTCPTPPPPHPSFPLLLAKNLETSEI